MRYFRYSHSQLKGMGEGSIKIIYEKLIGMGEIQIITETVQNLKLNRVF